MYARVYGKSRAHILIPNFSPGSGIRFREEIGKEKEALSFLKKIQKEFTEAPEAENIEIQIGRLEMALQ